MSGAGPTAPAAVIVTHDTREHALACVRTLGPAGAGEVVVVDAGSSDGTVAALRERHPGLEVVELPNVGYARAVNAGLARTVAPHVVVANADTRFDAGSVGRLGATLVEEPDVAVVGPAVRYPDGRAQASARRFPSLVGAAGHALLGLWWPRNPWTRRYRMRDECAEGPRDVDWVSGCALALRREAVEEVGGFDPGYFMFVEDADLAWRLRQRGWRVRFEPRAGVVHHVGASTDAAGAAMVVAHARSLDRFFGRVHAGRPTRWLRPLVRLALAAWVVGVLLWDHLVRQGSARSRTGE